MNSHKDEGQVFHDRADHEDTLHLSRTDLFISFNGFLAVAVGLVDDLVIRLVFIGMVLVVNVAWGLWAPNARRFIRALRNAGGHRVIFQYFTELHTGKTGQPHVRNYQFGCHQVAIHGFKSSKCGWICFLKQHLQKFQI